MVGYSFGWGFAFGQEFVMVGFARAER